LDRMRGMFEDHGVVLSYILLQARVPKEHPPYKMRQFVSDVLETLAEHSASFTRTKSALRPA
jgi:hypothetical protein